MLEGMEPSGPCVLVIFGAGGDLAKRLLFPALYNLAGEDLLPREFAVVGFARAALSEEEFRLGFRHDLLPRLSYVSSDFTDPAGYERLASKLRELDQAHGTRGNYLLSGHRSGVLPGSDRESQPRRLARSVRRMLEARGH